MRSNALYSYTQHIFTFSLFLDQEPIQFLFAIRAKMRTSQPNFIPLVAKGLNAGKYPGGWVQDWAWVVVRGCLGGAMEGEVDLESADLVLPCVCYKLEVVTCRILWLCRVFV
jgi:hypothetical protein